MSLVEELEDTMMPVYQAYLEAAGLPPSDHRNRQVSGSHTFAASNRPPQRRQASVFSAQSLS